MVFMSLVPTWKAVSGPCYRLLKSTLTLFCLSTQRKMFSQHFPSYGIPPCLIYGKQLSSPPLAFILLDLLIVLGMGYLKVSCLSLS